MRESSKVWAGLLGLSAASVSGHVKKLPPDLRGGAQIRKALRGELGAALSRTEKRFDESVVIAHSGTRVRGFQPQPVHNGQHRRYFNVVPLSP